MSDLGIEIVISFFVLAFVGFVFLLNIAIDYPAPNITDIVQDIDHE